MRTVIRAGLAGAATGARSFTGLAALAWSRPADPALQPGRPLNGRWARRLLTLAALQELALDKLPQAPSRTAPAGLVPRLAIGLAAGLIVARRSQPRPGAGTTVAASAVAAAAAACTAFTGPRWRAAATRNFGSDRVGAVLEDVWALALASAAAR
jgi:uncharacterized membrane protein